MAFFGRGCQGSPEKPRHWNIQIIRGFLRQAHMTREYMVLCRLESQENQLIFSLRGRKPENKRSMIQHQSETEGMEAPRESTACVLIHMLKNLESGVHRTWLLHVWDGVGVGALK